MEEVFLQLREGALEAASEGLALPPPDHPDVSGVVIDIPGEDGCATIVALTDGTVSMYTSSGGGVIGAGQHAPVAEANRRLLQTVQTYAERLEETSGEEDLPELGRVRLHVLTPFGRRYTDLPEDAFWGRATHPLMPVISVAQELLTAIREASD